MDISDNPFIKGTDYYADLNENIAKLKNNPSALDFERLCYDIFVQTELGKKFITECENKFLMPALCHMGTATFQIDVIWVDGFKAFVRMLKEKIMSHQQRIKSEMNKV